MRVLRSELWKHIGDDIYITEEYSEENLPQGTYIIESSEDYGLVLIKNGIDYLFECDDDGEFEVNSFNIEKNIQEIYKYKLKKVIRLLNEGCSIGAHLTDITPELHQLEVIKRLVDITQGNYYDLCK